MIEVERADIKSSLAIDALDQALQSRRPAGGSWRGQGLLLHSDRGVQYASDAFRAVLESHGIDRSMSRTGNCYDNTVAESFFATLKRELVNRREFASLHEVRQAIFEYIEVFATASAFTRRWNISVPRLLKLSTPLWRRRTISRQREIGEVHILDASPIGHRFLPGSVSISYDSRKLFRPRSLVLQR